MSLHCPSCGSSQVSTYLTAMRIAAFIGMLGGALRGAGTILLTGPAVTSSDLAKPPNVNLNALSSAILSGLVGAAGGCAMGAQLGKTRPSCAGPQPLPELRSPLQSAGLILLPFSLIHL